VNSELDGAVSVGFPLRGEWVAYNSPGDRIPSHGTDVLGQRFAYDFVRVDRRKGWHMHPAGGWRSNLIGVPVRECYAWGQPVHMPFDGEIIEARDGYPERNRVVPIREIAIVLKNGLTFDIKGDLTPIVGNHVLARSGDVFAVFAHLAPGSVAVSKGQVVRRADLIGRVGHTGNSTAPHLHFQLMDGPDPRTATGVPCAFTELEIEQADGWRRVNDAVPRRQDRIRWAGPGTTSAPR
jgi:murein DD-endopeptidase MepM/ murein hydrolase activator NlpD